MSTVVLSKKQHKNKERIPVYLFKVGNEHIFYMLLYGTQNNKKTLLAFYAQSCRVWTFSTHLCTGTKQWLQTFFCSFGLCVRSPTVILIWRRKPSHLKGPSNASQSQNYGGNSMSGFFPKKMVNNNLYSKLGKQKFSIGNRIVASLSIPVIQSLGDHVKSKQLISVRRMWEWLESTPCPPSLNNTAFDSIRFSKLSNNGK